MSATTRNLFALTDAMDVAALVSLFAEDARVAFGNGQPNIGVDEIRTDITTEISPLPDALTAFEALRAGQIMKALIA